MAALWAFALIMSLGATASSEPSRTEATSTSKSLPPPSNTQTEPIPSAAEASPEVATRPADISGIQRPGQEPGDISLELLSSLFWVPRQAIEVLFYTSSSTAELIDDEQIIPRVEDTLNPPKGELRVFPTLFVETAGSFSLGSRLLARSSGYSSTLRVGFGGRRDLVAESRIRATLSGQRPLSLGLEALHDVRGRRSFLGVGQDPERDPRNRFLPSRKDSTGHYQETRERFIASIGVRLISDLELIFSTSLTRRHQENSEAEDALSFSSVFETGTVPGGLGLRTLSYAETALRLDTRKDRSGPHAGFQIETYLGHAQDLRPSDISFFRAGGRLATYIPIYRRSNILSPRVVIDTLQNVGGSAVPFNELTRQGDFRGFDNRRDHSSLVASLDYRWTLNQYLATRLFFDLAQVAPTLPSLLELDPRYVGGLGFDIFTRKGPLGSVTSAVGPEGYKLMLHFGVAGSFGDRQHRD